MGVVFFFFFLHHRSSDSSEAILFNVVNCLKPHGFSNWSMFVSDEITSFPKTHPWCFSSFIDKIWFRITVCQGSMSLWQGQCTLCLFACSRHMLGKRFTILQQVAFRWTGPGHSNIGILKPAICLLSFSLGFSVFLQLSCSWKGWAVSGIFWTTLEWRPILSVKTWCQLYENSEVSEELRPYRLAYNSPPWDLASTQVPRAVVVNQYICVRASSPQIPHPVTYSERPLFGVAFPNMLLTFPVQ